MSISSIQAGNKTYEYFNSTKCKSDINAEPGRRDSGPDTVTFSDQAREMAQGEKSESGENKENPKFIQEQSAARPASFSLKDQGINLFSMLFESLFLAELESTEEPSQSVEDGSSELKGSLLKDSEKVGEIKKLIDDVMTGKADLSDIPQAMSIKSGKSDGAYKSSANTKTQGKDTEVEINKL